LSEKRKPPPEDLRKEIREAPFLYQEMRRTLVAGHSNENYKRGY
jgi:hypothetical protein